jgi:hypothetical protein
MRGSSPLTPSQRELIAAFPLKESKGNITSFTAKISPLASAYE